MNTTEGFGLLRIPVLGVEESARLVASGRLDDPTVATAVDFAADPSLRPSAERSERARATLLRYLARMGGRATPYGLFAGTAPSTVGSRRELVVEPRERHGVRARVDIRVLEEVVARALSEADPDTPPLRLNPSAARSGGDTVRFAAPGDATAPVVRVRATPAILTVMELLGERELDAVELVRLLAEHLPGVGDPRLLVFVRDLRDRGLLQVSDGLLVPGVEPVDRAVHLLERVGDRGGADALRALGDDLAEPRPFDGRLRASLDTVWEKAADRIPLLRDVVYSRRFDLHPELSMRSAVLDRRTVSDLRSAMRRVAFLSRPGVPVGLDVGAFRDAFVRRFEDSEVPLLEALDLETGVLSTPGRGVSTLASEAGLSRGPTSTDPSIAPELLDLFADHSGEGGPVDIAHLPEAQTEGSRAVMAVLLGAGDPSAHDGPHSVLVGGVGRSPYSLAARFGLGRPEIADRLHEGISDAGSRARSGVEPLHVELVHHAGGRIGNVLVRPRLLCDTIALAGAHGGTLHPGRLLLQWRPEGFRLSDAVTGRPVVVELNTAHNVDLHGLDPIYSLLGHLASGGGTAWSWGPLTRMPHLPRVTCGRVIVAPERWVLSTERMRRVLDAPSPAAELRRHLPGLGERRWVGTGEYDHVLPIDLEDDTSVRAVLGRSKGEGSTALVEMPQLEEPAVRGPEGGHVAEVVVPLGPVLRTPPRPAPGVVGRDVRHGDAWVYARFHCGHAGADRIIDRSMRLADGLRSAGDVDRWFFLRYEDEEGYHVRLRLRAITADTRARTLLAVAELGERLLSEGLATRTRLDRYVPEIARYGGAEGLRAAEALFTVSSDRVAGYLPEITGDEDRLHLAVADTVHWCRGVFDSHEERLEFLAVCQNGLEVSAPKEGNLLGRFVRAREKGLRAALERISPDERVTEALRDLAAAQAPEARPRDRWSVFGSALHLHLNRVFAFDAVRMEYLAHEFARRHVLRARALEGRDR